ncbi:MAG TPA: pilus assembly protein N-terminal domain-containing protein, partial [Xanthobacteraceae bacterium]|nr:pilus assembly protein N-terminal domain-containing protein [Xanthobacteraceae bacterium]
MSRFHLMKKAAPVWVDGRGLRVTARRMSAGLMIGLMCNVSFSQTGWAQDMSSRNAASQNAAPQIAAPQTTAPQSTASQNAASPYTAALPVPLHTSTVNVIMGKSQDVRTDLAYADISVGNSDVADASPLTDHSISILGKKIGTTRVSVYDQDKRPVGIYDVEVSYDVSRLSV